MRLKRVELIGFKSFMDRTVIEFRDGITTILGPNGCGKSNVVDAVRWVLGEQSAKQLRGEKMEDVIFKGTRKRKPLSVAEVALHFDNGDGQLGIPYTEVSISRRVTRAGTSDYFLNKAPCRLKDIKDLFYDTGVGNNAYSVIEQEIVGQVLDPHENKVRTILEEGSGIVRYKVKRKDALRKLELTERDLLRVEDIIDEIGRQVRSLARQVGKARRHQRLFNEVKGLELLRAWHRIAQVRHRLGELEEQTERLRTEGAGDDAELARRRVELEGMRPAIDGLEELRRARSHELSQVESDLAAIEAELLVLREKIESAGRRRTEIEGERERARARSAEIEREIQTASTEKSALSRKLEEEEVAVRRLEEEAKSIAARHESARGDLMQAQQMSLGFLKEETEHRATIAAAESRLSALGEQQTAVQTALEEAKARREHLQGELSEAEGEAEGLRRRRDDLRQQREWAARELAAAEEEVQARQKARAEVADELARAESRHEIAERIAQEFEGYRAGAAALLKGGTQEGKLRGALAENLKVEPGYERAFELFFGEDADALLVDSVTDADELARRLASEDLGQASFLTNGMPPPPDAHAGDGLPGRPALDLVRPDSSARAHTQRWLAGVRVVETAEEATAAALEHAGRGLSFLARSGLFVRHDGLVRGGAGSRRELSLFGRKERIDQLAATVEDLRRRASEREREEAEQLARRDAARTREKEVQEQLATLMEEIRASGEVSAGRRSALAHETSHEEDLQRQRGQTQRAMDDLLQEIEMLETTLGRHGEDQLASQERVDALGGDVSQLEGERERAHDALAEARLQLTHDRGLDRELASRIERLEAMRQDLEERLQRLGEEQAALADHQEEWEATTAQRQSRLGELFETREEEAETLRRIQSDIEAKRAEMEAVQEAMRAISERQREKSDRLHEIDTARTRDQLTIQNVEDRIREKFHVEVEAGYRGLDPQTLPRELVREEETFQLEQVEELLQERQARLERLGPVNFVALDEYEEKRTRLQFLEKQRDDLRASKEDLLQAIDRINKTARQLFRDTFEQVRQNFQQIFSTLFEGGRADLELIKSDDPLEGDVVIHARPAGKRVDSVALLSGGERALTAIALLFSVYLIKPSPFCLLDEVDAPLDDINVGRFVRLLQRFQDRTQFIVITHNKLTMEAADHLYGVTMEESGVSRLVSVSFEELDAEDPLQALEEKAATMQAARSGAARLEPIGDAEGEVGRALSPAWSQLEGEA